MQKSYAQPIMIWKVDFLPLLKKWGQQFELYNLLMWSVIFCDTQVWRRCSAPLGMRSSSKWFKILKQTGHLEPELLWQLSYLQISCGSLFWLYSNNEGLARKSGTKEPLGKQAPSLVIGDKGRAYSSISRSGILVCFVCCYTPGLGQYLKLDAVQQIFLKWIKI